MTESPPVLIPECNLCGAQDVPARGAAIGCTRCGANARTRVIWLILSSDGVLRPGQRVLHLAPERMLSERIRAVVGAGYEPADLRPDEFPHVAGVRKLDLARNAAALPSRHYDLILHSHVMEHVPCNVTAVLFHLHRALKPGGRQVCCIPFTRDGFSAEDLGPLDEEDAIARFGQDDHVRVFGGRDVQSTLGMIFRLPHRYDLPARFDEAVLLRHGIPPSIWRSWSPSSILVIGKDDLLLKG